MRNLATTVFTLILITFIAAPVMAQSDGDFRTQASGDWSDPQIWQTYNGSAWVATATPPDGSETITVDSTGQVDSVWVDVETTISGRLIHHGIVAADDEVLAVGDGGVYEYARDAGDLAIVTWQEGSTFEITGVVAEAPDDRGQNYYNLTFNTPELLSNLNMDMDSVTVAGDIRVIETNFGRWYLTTTEPNDTNAVTIEGDVIVEGGAFSVQGTSTPNSTFIVHHYGNVDVTGGNFSISRGSQPNGTTTWYMHEGDFSMADAETQSSTVTPEGAAFVFTKEGTQTLTLENVDFSSLPIEVDSATTLVMGSSTIEGSGHFTVVEGAMIATTLPGGVAAIFPGEDTIVNLEEGSSYRFDGTEAQITSTMMPTVVEDLTISNPAGVTLSQETTINGVLLLEEGVFDNTIPFELGPEGTIVEEGGSLQEPVAAEDENELPETFYVEQNFPNPFNPSTVIRYGLPTASEVTFTVYNMLGQEVRAWSEGHKSAGVHEFVFEAHNLSSGMYIYRVQAGAFEATKQMVLVE